MTTIRVLYAVGVACGSLCGFLSPLPYLGFAPIAVGLIWAAYDLTDVEESESDNPPPTATLRQ